MFIKITVLVIVVFSWITTTIVAMMPSYVKPIWHGPRSIKTVALTFDDGPHPDYSNTILDVLNTHDVSATFFVVGRSVLAYKTIVQRMAAEGHELGNHTFTHQRLDQLAPAEMVLEMDSINRLVREVTGQNMTFFRPPGGRYNRYVLDHLKTTSMQMVLWDINTGDYYVPVSEEDRSDYPYAKNTVQKKAARVVKEILESVQSGSIILLHNTDGETIKALPQIITALRGQGYRFVTLSKMLKEGSLVVKR
ncbi:polysaccharide deacetylase family protein [bacterium]|nr:polysaccharide deacetylase family protein [bacterium]